MDAADEPENQDDTRAENLLPEERAAGSDIPHEQAEVLLDDSEVRSLDRDAAPSSFVEHRTSEQATPPPGT